MTKTRTTLLALLGVGLLAITAIAGPVLAKPGPEGTGDDRRGPKDGADRPDRPDKNGTHRPMPPMMKGNATRERCLDEAGNATVNETDEKRCMRHGEFAEKAFKARRAAHALLGAINATERILARLNDTEANLTARLAEGNLTANETERIEKRLERIDAKQERLTERLEQLRERLDRLHGKWALVREHVEERRFKHVREHGERPERPEDQDDDEDDSESSESESATPTPTSTSSPTA